MNLKTKRKHLNFQATIRKNYKEYLVAKTFGNKVTVKDPYSDISLDVSEGVKAVVVQSVNTDFHLLKKVIAANECFASPVVQFHIDEQSSIENTQGYRYKLTIPHYLSRHHSLSAVKVKYGSLKRPVLMKEVPKAISESGTFPFYQISKKYITIYADHFCDVVCTSAQKVCTSKIIAIPFGWIGTLGSDSDTHIKDKTYLCSYLYKNSDLTLVRFSDFYVALLFDTVLYLVV